MTTAAGIRRAAYEARRTDPEIDRDDSVVEVMGGDVLLNGTVPSEAQRTEATVAVQRAAGVSTVHNLLDVALPSDDTVTTRRSPGSATRRHGDPRRTGRRRGQRA